MIGIEENASPGPHRGDVGAGFCTGCFPFTMESTITAAMNALDLISDWLMYKAFLHLHLPDRTARLVSRSDESLWDPTIWRLQHIYAVLPQIFFYICVVASVLYAIELVWFVYMFVNERKKFKDKRDGLQKKQAVLVKYGGEIIVLMHVLFENLPVMTVLFLSQVAVCCQLLLYFRNTIYLLATAITLVSLVWKSFQVLWNAGCLGQRESYHRGYCLCAFRLFTILLVASGVVLTSLNLILLPASKNSTPVKHHDLKKSIFNKVVIDQWTRKDSVILVQAQRNDNMNSQNTLSENITNHITKHKTHLFDFEELLRQGEYGIEVRIPCETQINSFVTYFQPEHNSLFKSNCSIGFKFILSEVDQTIQYDHFYFFYGQHRECFSGTLVGSVPQMQFQSIVDQEPGQANQSPTDTERLTHSPSETDLTDSSTQESTDSPPSVSKQSLTHSPPTDDLHTCSLSFNLCLTLHLNNENWVPCRYTFVNNDTLISKPVCS